MSVKPNEIEIIRVYDAPVKLVWETWTELRHVEKWWGPRGFTLTTHSKELRPGGKWIYTMHGPDGTDYPNIATYHEVVPYEKLVYDHGGNEERPKLFSVVATFREDDGKTTLRLVFSVGTADEAKAMKEHIRAANGNSTWDRLGEYLENEQSGQDVFVINRSIEAKPDDVYKMWANPEKFALWLGPDGVRTKFIQTDVREGGSAIWSMTGADGTSKEGRLLYHHLHKGVDLEYDQHFSNAQGHLRKAPFSDSYPDVLKTRVDFVAEDEGQTRITVKWSIQGKASEAERATFHAMKSVMTSGWNQSFDKLETLLRRS